MSHATRDCIDCGRHMRHIGRGLCGRCYYFAQQFGVLHEYPRINRPYTWTWEDYDELAAQGYSRLHAAERLGLTKAALEKAIERRPREEEVA